MPLPHRFLAGGAPALVNAPQLVVLNSLRTVGSAKIRRQSLHSAPRNIEHLLTSSRLAGKDVPESIRNDRPLGGVANITSSQRGYDSKAAKTIVATDDIKDPLYLARQKFNETYGCLPYVKNIVKVLRECEARIEQISEGLAELRFIKWLKDTHGKYFVPPKGNTLEAVRQSIEEVKQYISEERLKKLDNRVEASSYPFASHVNWLHKEFLKDALDVLVWAHGETNRAIKYGEVAPHQKHLRDIARIAERKVQKAPGKDHYKIAYKAPTFEELPVHERLSIVQAKLGRIQRQFENIRYRSGLGEKPIRLRSEISLAVPSKWDPILTLSIPKRKPGTERLWFQPPQEIPPDPTVMHSIGKHVIQLPYNPSADDLLTIRKKREKLRLSWYHSEGLPTEDTEPTMRIFASRQKWEAAYDFRKAVPTELQATRVQFHYTREPREIPELQATRVQFRYTREPREIPRPSGPRIMKYLVQDRDPDIPDNGSGGSFGDADGDIAAARKRWLETTAKDRNQFGETPENGAEDIDAESKGWIKKATLPNGIRIRKYLAGEKKEEPVKVYKEELDQDWSISDPFDYADTDDSQMTIRKTWGNDPSREINITSDEAKDITPKVRYYVSVTPETWMYRKDEVSSQRQPEESRQKWALEMDVPVTNAVQGESQQIRSSAAEEKPTQPDLRGNHPIRPSNSRLKILKTYHPRQDIYLRELWRAQAAKRADSSSTETVPVKSLQQAENDPESDDGVKILKRYLPRSEEYHRQLEKEHARNIARSFDMARGFGMARSIHTSTKWNNPQAYSFERTRVTHYEPQELRLKEKRHPFLDKESALQRKLELAEMERKTSLAAIRQGQEFHMGGVSTPPEDMMEETDFVQTLAELATGGVEDVDETSGMGFMDVGDLIELRSFGGDSELGIFIQPPLQKNGSFLFLTETGKIKTWVTTGMVFTIPKFVSIESAELLRKYISQLPDEGAKVDPPRQLTKPLTDKIREFSNKALSVFSRKLPVLERLYDQFADDVETKLVTTLEATRAVFPEGYENSHVYAVHLALMGDSSRFTADSGRDHKRTGQFQVRSRKDYETLKKVTEWLRMKTVTLSTGQRGKKHTEVIESFAQKAAALIDKSRELRGDQPQLFKPVQAIPMEEFGWDENDKEIIQFLKMSLERYWFQASPVAAHYPHVLRASGRYVDEWLLDVDLLYIFLMEIGVFRPWENYHRFSDRIPLPYHGKSVQVDKIAAKVEEVNNDTEAAFKNLGLKDKFENYREQIQETIFAIDEASAEEIDDGFSLEVISDTESWVHVHIANPTAFLEPDSWISQMAERQQTTIYLPERTFPMMPRGLVDYKFGLGTNRPTFTFSVKVNNHTGDILDYKFKHGIAREVKRLTYNQYNEILGHPVKIPSVLIINPPRDPKTGEIIPPPPPPPPTPVTDEELRLLTTLRQIAIALKKKRATNGSLSFISVDYTIKMHENPASGIPRSQNSVAVNPDMPVLYKGLPSLIFSRGVGPTPATETVAEFMLLAGTVVAHFLSTHKVPAPFRCHSLSPRKGTQQIWETILLPARNEMGIIDKKILREHFTVLGASRLQPFAGAHDLLGLGIDQDTQIGGYTKATSPLRRFTDMLTHYQLEAAMLNQYNNLPLTQNLPFSEQYFARTLPMMLTHERRVRGMQANSEKFWIWKLIRWGLLETKVVPGREHVMPKTYTIELTSKNQYPSPSMGILHEFGVPMKFYFNSAKEWERADWGCFGEVVVDQSLWSRVKVNMRWKNSLPDNHLQSI